MYSADDILRMTQDTTSFLKNFVWGVQRNCDGKEQSTAASTTATSSFIKYLANLEKKLYKHPFYRSVLIFRPVKDIFSFLCQLPFKLFYWFYIFPFIFFWSQVWHHALEPTIKILCKRSELINSMFEHVLALIDILQRIRLKMATSKWSDLLRFAFTTLYEIFVTVVYSPDANNSEEEEFGRDNHHMKYGSEVIEYEDYDDEDSALGDAVNKRRSLKGIHSNIPTNLFRVKVKVNMGADESDNLSLVPSQPNEESMAEPDSPASFPSTPFSRHYVMNRSAERVASIMFAARDRLRMEALSVSRDEYSRMVAKENQSTGQYAIFDPRNHAAGINLTCGNHCVMKVGKSFCSSCRSMIPIRVNSYVYVEYSVTSSSSQVPIIGIGVSPDDCPLNVMVGSWPLSAGLYTDGQLLVSSQFFQNTEESLKKVDPGSTIGMLIYLSREPVAPDISNFLSDQSEPEINLPHASAPTIQQNGDIIPTLVKFNINGKPLWFAPETIEKIQELSAIKVPLYPTISLFSEETRVWCRFCEADIIYRSRQSIQAPPNVKVYCLDGSLLLSENQ